MDGILQGVKSVEEFDRSGREDAAWLKDLVGRGKVVLDLGCGVGRIEKFLAPDCKELWAADVSPVMLGHASQRLAGISSVRLVLVDGDGILPCPDRTFDAVFSLLVLQHLEKEDAFRYLIEFNRVLKPDGLCIIQFPDITSESYFRDFLRFAAVTARQRSIGRPRFYTLDEAVCFMTKSGFRIEKTMQRASEIICIAKKTESITLEELLRRSGIESTEWEKILGKKRN